MVIKIQNVEIHIEDITWPHVDMNFIFECSTRYLTRPLRSLVRCQVEHEKIKFISTSGHVIFCLLYKLMTTFLTIFRRFLTTFRRFPNIFQNCSEGKTNFSEHFSDIFLRLPKISEDNEDFRGEIDDVSIIQQDIQVLFKWLRNHSNGDHFSNYGNANALTCER